MKIIPLNVCDITKALVKQLEESEQITGLDGPDVTVERSEQGDDPSKCPWLCVYRFANRFPTRALGLGPGYRSQNVDLAIVVQHSDATSGQECEDRMEELVQATMGALLSDTTIGGTVQTLGDQIDVTYPDFQLKDGQYIQTAVINFTALAVVNVES